MWLKFDASWKTIYYFTKHVQTVRTFCALWFVNHRCYPYFPWLLHWHCASHVIIPVPVKPSWSICVKASWWRHQMETFSALLAICAGNSPVPGEFPAQRPVTRRFDVFFDLRLNKRLSKQSWGWWFETPSRPLWRHRNDSMNNLKLHNHNTTNTQW